MLNRKFLVVVLLIKENLRIFSEFIKSNIYIIKQITITSTCLQKEVQLNEPRLVYYMLVHYNMVQTKFTNENSEVSVRKVIKQERQRAELL